MPAETLFLRTMLTSEGAVANSVSEHRSPTKIVYQAENQDYSPSVRASTQKPHIVSGMKPRGFALARDGEDSADTGHEAVRLSFTNASKQTTNMSGMRAFEASLLGQANKSTRGSNVVANSHLRQVVPIHEGRAIRGSQVTYTKDQIDLDVYRNVNTGISSNNTAAP